MHMSETKNIQERRNNMESIKVTTENLVAQAVKVESEAADYLAKYNQLLADVDSLTSTDFTGDDANAFRTKVRGFEPEFKKMKELMEAYAQHLRDAAKTYENTQADVKGRINGLR